MPSKKATASGFHGRGGIVGNGSNYASIGKIGTTAQMLRRTLNKSHGSRMARAILLALTGAAVGAASKAYSTARISAGASGGQQGQNLLGGKRTVETVVKQTGVTVAQDLTDLDQTVATKNRPASYPADKSGFKPGRIGSL